MKNTLQITLPIASVAICMPAAERWLSVPAMFGTGAEFQSRVERIALVTDGPGIEAHGAKSALRAEKRALAVRSTTSNPLDGYGFGNPVDVTAPRGGVPTGVPPRSRPV
jgi:hypothetical protein